MITLKTMDNTQSTCNNGSDSMKYMFVTVSMSNSGKSTTYHRVASSNGCYLNVDCGLCILRCEKFCEIFIFRDDTKCHHDCGINELRWHMR